jgi:hypothetical protein
MLKISSYEQLKKSDISEQLKEYLITKVISFLSEYNCSDIGDVFSIILLAENEVSYVSDKLLEFYEIINNHIHTVWASSDGYSEDIYIPYSKEVEKIITRRCEDV